MGEWETFFSFGSCHLQLDSRGKWSNKIEAGNFSQLFRRVVLDWNKKLRVAQNGSKWQNVQCFIPLEIDQEQIRPIKIRQMNICQTNLAFTFTALDQRWQGWSLTCLVGLLNCASLSWLPPFLSTTSLPIEPGWVGTPSRHYPLQHGLSIKPGLYFELFLRHNKILQSGLNKWT